MFEPTPLHRALAAHLGQTLTPEVAASILATMHGEAAEGVALVECFDAYVIALEQPAEGELERLGHEPRIGARYATVRAAVDLVGFCRFFVTQRGAYDAGMYIAPEHRKGLLAVRLTKFVTDSARLLGASAMYWECEKASGTASICRYLKYREHSRRFVVEFRGV